MGRGINIEEETWINKMCRSEETLEKLDNAEAMIGRATNLLRELQALGLKPSEGEERSLFRRRVVQVTSELEDVRDLLTASARAVLSERQLEVLEPQGVWSGRESLGSVSTLGSTSEYTASAWRLALLTPSPWPWC